MAYFTPCNAQESAFRTFFHLRCPEKRWVLFHPFIAHKAFKLTCKASNTAREMLHDPLLDADGNGGQVDAFRHAYWMALLSENFCWRKALRLGKAHERANYIDFKRKHYEEGSLPDSSSSAMDLFNNEAGAGIARKNKKMSEDSLKLLVRNEILAGNLRIIYKDKSRRELDCNGKPVDTTLFSRKWNIPKCLVPSNMTGK